MASLTSWSSKFLLMTLTTFAIIAKPSVADPVFRSSPWASANATFYGGETASGTMGGGGDVSNMWVKGSKTEWIEMKHNWGASYQVRAQLGGQSLSFKLTSDSTKETIIARDAAPENWKLGSTYKTRVNFH
ncbi:hypothetical protein V6N13_041047 [Hibiscus sabdariffa]